MRVTLAPNETRQVEKAGYSVYIMDAPGVVEVTIDNESEELQAGQGIPSNGVMFHSVRLVNLEAVEQTVELSIASNNRGIISNRLSGSVRTIATGGSSVNGLPQVEAVAAGLQVVDGNLNRLMIEIQCDSGNLSSVWLGGTAPGMGQKLDAGDAWSGQVSGDLNLYFEGAGVAYLSEVVE